MKSRYFAPETIQQASLAMLNEVDDLRYKHDNFVFKPERAALLVLDMQEYFIAESSHAFIPSALAILPGVQALIATFGACQHPIIFTCHENLPDDARLMAVWWHDLLASHSSMASIATGFDTSLGKVLRKHQYDAFYETELEAVLLADGVSQVVVTGVMTHLCCETTARSAFMRGFEVFFCVDGTATYNEAFHRATILNLAHGFAVPVLVDEVLAGFKDFGT
jgi:bifunctional isochorismate lyase/aryl carrier protein